MGAFAAHGLKGRLTDEALALWQTAVHYHAWHALGLLAVGFLDPSTWSRVAGWALAAGIVLFSGTLYAMSLGAPRGLGALTPFGGAAFIAGWLAFAWAAISARTPG